MSARIILAGCGNMGFAMLQGWLGTGIVHPSAVLVAEPNDAFRRRAEELGARVAAGAEGIEEDEKPELVVVAVKPQVIRAVLEGYRRFGGGATSFLSVAAGTLVSTFVEAVGQGTPVMRAMPNLPAAVGKGVIGLFAAPDVPPATRDFAEKLLAANGSVVRVESEGMIDAVTAVSGSGPGYVFLFIEALAQAARSFGFSEEDALVLARDTVWGAGALVHETRGDPGELRRQVTSVGGTTAAGLSVLMTEDRLQRLVGGAVEAALNRAKELAKS
ncbi:MAG TPA: pyrroline-5-carboxylate reductase [Mesorhizobium sp.]|jgi:pyrroline-5-carboxylate reductase|nr:pyrroline-5-carboxylate reductase [Mesorhizobium sp.]